MRQKIVFTRLVKSHGECVEIGTTRSGKSITSDSHLTEHRDWTNEDHFDAHAAHQAVLGDYAVSSDPHKAQLHLAAMTMHALAQQKGMRTTRPHMTITR